MSTNEDGLNDVDVEKIRTSLILHTPIEITTYTLPRNMENYMQEILCSFLVACNQQEMTEYLSFCLGELLTNAKKANTKRIYFKEKELDINNEKDYEEGMKNFREETFANIDHYLELQKKAGLYIKLILQISNEFLKVEIRNNSKLTVFENRRIQEKLSSVHKYTAVEEVLTEVLDQTEGSGLGIIIMVLMLQKVGLSENNYQVISTDDETITRIVLPLRGVSCEHYPLVAEKFASIHSTVPMVSDDFNIFLNVMHSPDAKTSDIYERAMKNPSIALLLLINANKNGHSCFNLREAIDYLGFDKLQEIFNKENTELAIVDKSDIVLHLYNHMVSTAFFAYNLAQNFYPELDLDKVYLTGMIHDMQCLFLECASEEEKGQLKIFIIDNKISETIYDSFMHFVYHSRGGRLFAEKWHFPEEIGKIIAHHHDVEHVPEDIAKICKVIYFADVMQHYIEHGIDFYQIEENILREFKIDTEEKFRFLLDRMNSEFEKFYR